MGAEYRPDWTSDCTLLICAFSNTPKFRQVESDNGTVVSKVTTPRLVFIVNFNVHVFFPLSSLV